MRLTEIAETMELPETRVADAAWDRARARVRRRRTAAAVATVTAALIVVAAVPLVGDRHQTSTPPPVTTPTRSPEAVADATVPRSLISPRWTSADYTAAASGAPRLAITDPVPLSEDPVGRAVLAVVPSSAGPGDARWTTIDVLGDDGRWRSLDLEGLVPTHDVGGYQWYPLTPTSLSADGTELALAQPGAVVVVELTTGRSHRYDVPGLNKATSWAGDDHLLVRVEERETMRELDLDTGSLVDTDLEQSTRVLPDGTAVTWGLDGLAGTPAVGGDSGAQRTVPLVGDGVIVQLAGFNHRVGSTTYMGRTAVAAVDRHSGELLGVRMSPVDGVDFSQLLAVDDHSALISLVPPDSTDHLLIRWDWAARTTEVLAVLPAQMASYAGTVDEAATMVR
ncbi:hypothetical protein [Nocardioides sp. HB32]